MTYDEWQKHLHQYWNMLAIANPPAPGYGPFVFGAPQNWTTDDEPAPVEADGEYPPDPPKCADCKGEGTIVLYTSVVKCEKCDGSGY